jgi:hypothetical protein
MDVAGLILANPSTSRQRKSPLLLVLLCFVVGAPYGKIGFDEVGARGPVGRHSDAIHHPSYRL